MTPADGSGVGPEAARSWRFLALLFGAWAIGTAWCLAGVPPLVDLAGHGAQMQTLVSLFRKDPLVSTYYRPDFHIGYGIELWLFAPLAWLTNGAVAAKVALWCALQLFVLSLWALARVFQRPVWLLFLGLPLAFNMSYWYGLLPGLFSHSLTMFSVAAYVRANETRSWRWLVALNLLAAATLLTHLFSFALLAVVLGAFALVSAQRWAALRTLVAGMGLSVALSLPRVLTLADRAVETGPWPTTDYNLGAHFNWFFKHYRPEGRLAALAPLVIAGVLMLAALLRRPRARKEAVWGVLALMLTYFVTPKTLSGIYLVCMRIPAVAGMLALFVVDPAVLPRWLKASLVALAAASLVETAVFHQRFAREVDGLWEIVERAPNPGVHGFVTLQGDRVLGSVPVYLEHLGEWWTARQGGVGHNFFANYDHHPARQVPGRELPLRLEQATPEERAQFDQVLILGPGVPPPPFDTWPQVDAAGPWRRLKKP